MNLISALQNAVGFILAAACWGLTNPFIKLGTEGLSEVKADQPGWFNQSLAEYKFLFTNWKYVLPLVINLSGSVVYYYTLGQSDISLAVPITNSLALLFTLLGGYALGEKIQGKETWFGVFLVMAGASLCIISKETV